MKIDELTPLIVGSYLPFQEALLVQLTDQVALKLRKISRDWKYFIENNYCWKSLKVKTYEIGLADYLWTISCKGKIAYEKRIGRMVDNRYRGGWGFFVDTCLEFEYNTAYLPSSPFELYLERTDFTNGNHLTKILFSKNCKTYLFRERLLYLLNSDRPEEKIYFSGNVELVEILKCLKKSTVFNVLRINFFKFKNEENKIEIEEVNEIVAILEGNKNLTILDLGKTIVSEEGLKNLVAAIRNNKNLLKFDLGEKKVAKEEETILKEEGFCEDEKMVGIWRRISVPKKDE